MLGKAKPHYEHLKEKWTVRHRGLQKNLFSKHKEAVKWIKKNPKEFAIGSLGGLMLLTSPSAHLLPSPNLVVANEQKFQDFDKSVFLIADLDKQLPSEIRPLTELEEREIANKLSNTYGLRVTAELDGKKLNRSYGLIGAEQHLARYPGDSMGSHFDTQEEANKYWSSGMAPGLGAWGYFSSGAQLTNEDKLREKYYIAVQTFLAPGFNENPREVVNFFKYRKMLVVNPNNGKAMIVVIGDAGPAQWTGKHLGGSPEVMSYLERYDGVQRGPVLYFFIDDPEDKVPLGPLERV